MVPLSVVVVSLKPLSATQLINRCFERIKLMDDSEQRQRLCPDDDLEAERSIARQSLDEMLSEIERATRDAGLYYPIGLTVPYSGDAVAKDSHDR